MKPVAATLRVLSGLLGYPDGDLRACLPDMRAALLSEGALPPERMRALDALITSLEDARAFEAEGEYVRLFDCGRSTSLHLFEHVHGESRERGPAMIDLAQMYEKAGLYLRPGELPDYLPVALEFASTQPPRQARAFLGEIAHIVNAIHGALHRRKSPYAAVPAALLELAGEKPREVAIEEEAAVDEAWEEPPVFAGCSSRGQARPGEPQPIHIVRNAAKPGATA